MVVDVMDAMVPAQNDAGCSGLSQAVGRVLVSPAPTGIVGGLPVVSDGALMSAATINRRRIRLRINQAHWSEMPDFKDIQSGIFSDQVGECVVDVHGDPDFGGQGLPRLTYEVMVCYNEFLRYGDPLHPYMRFLYIWARPLKSPRKT